MPTRMGNRGPVPGRLRGASNVKVAQDLVSRCDRKVVRVKGAIVRTLRVRTVRGGPGGQGRPGGPGERSFGPAPSVAVPMGQGLVRALLGRPGCFLRFQTRCRRRQSPETSLHRKPTQRQRPTADKREIEGERKLHPTRQRPGAGGRGVSPVAPPEPRRHATSR